MINFAYDGHISTRSYWAEQNEPPNHLNNFDGLYYPINGPFEDFYYDYHAPLQTVCEKNNIPAKCVLLEDALNGTEKFIYVLTFRYFVTAILKPDLFCFLSPKLINAINFGQCLLILNDSHECSYYKHHHVKEHLIEHFSHIGLSYDHVIWLTGNPRNDPTDCPIKIIFWQFFETSIRLCSDNVEISPQRYEDKDNLKKFLCLNRVPREHRYYFAYRMYKNDETMQDFWFSLNKTDTIESHNNLISKTDPQIFNRMLNSLPWIVDTDEFNKNLWDRINSSFHQNNLIYIVTETLLGAGDLSCFLTEKIFKPIAYHMPFIVIGDMHSLKQLRDLGYKTFSDFWDESYDDVFDPFERIDAICNLVENLGKKSYGELIATINKMQPLLDYNRKLLKSRRPEAAVLEHIKKYEEQ